MDKEKVTEELVRQNGNQAAAVMADYAGQGGGGGGGSIVEAIAMTQEELSLVTGVPSGKQVKGGLKVPSSLPIPLVIESLLIFEDGREINRFPVLDAYLINDEIDEIHVLSADRVLNMLSFYAPDSSESGLNLSALPKGFLYQINLEDVVTPG